MIMKEDQARLRALLTEAVRIILKNGLRFCQEISIEGLLGVTLDSTDVFLININETIRNEMSQQNLAINQFNNNNGKQNYIPRLLEHSTVANALGLPFMESLESLSSGEPPSRSFPTKRLASSPRRRGSSPGTSPAPQQTLPPHIPSFSSAHTSNRFTSSGSTLRPHLQEVERGEFEPPPKRIHHETEMDCPNPVSIAPYRHEVIVNEATDHDSHSRLSNQPPDLIPGSNNGPVTSISEQGRVHLYPQLESHNVIRNGVNGSGVPGRPHSESSSLPSPLSPPPPPPYSHYMSSAAIAAGIVSNHHSKPSHQNHLPNVSHVPPPYHQQLHTTQAHVAPLSQSPTESRCIQILPEPNREDPINILRNPSNAQHVVGQLVDFFSKTERENDGETKKTPLPSFQSLTKSGGGTLPSFANQFKPGGDSVVQNFPSSATVLGVATPTKIQQPELTTTVPGVQSPPAAIISPLKIKTENNVKVIEPTSRGRKPKSPKDGGPASEFRCEYCGRVFTSWSGRYFHMASHTGKYKHTCFLCKKGFMQTRLYNIHLQSHQKEYEKSHPNKSPEKSATEQDV